MSDLYFSTQYIPFLFVKVIIAILFLKAMLFQVDQQTVAIVERFGKFSSLKKSGLNIKIPFIDRVVERISLRIRQLDVIVDTKTEDNVFLRLKISVQFRVISSKVFEAYYELDDPETQINSYIFDVVRAAIPKMPLDDVFVKKDEVADIIQKELHDAMDAYGYDIVKALVTDIDPDVDVKNAMNRINAAERFKKAAEYEGDAEKIVLVKKAEAEAESKRLQGEGMANQRREISKGLEDSVKSLVAAGIDPREASAMILLTQHYDTLNAIGSSSRSNLLLLPNSPEAVTQSLSNMTAAFSAALRANAEADK